MSEAHPSRGTHPRLGKVNEMCQEWMVREDGAMAYQLQNQEISKHYSGNKQRNQMVREDFPKAKSEQMKEQEMAEQAAAIYQKMLAEQEELDNVIAQQLAKKLEHEERLKKQVEELRDERLAKQLLDKEAQRRQIIQKESRPIPSSSRHLDEIDQVQMVGTSQSLFKYNDMDVIEKLSSVHIKPPSRQKSQEEADEELARMLQEQEGNIEENLLQRDRLLAIEAQDKELAKVLQERERMKARRAKERARQKALAKKQQQSMRAMTENNASDQLLPDDSYSNPLDVLPAVKRDYLSSLKPNNTHPMASQSEQFDGIEYEDNYTLPVNSKENDFASTSESFHTDSISPIRPSHLNLRPTFKPRYPDPEEGGSSSNSHHVNIAMAIDPTYSKHESLSHSQFSHSPSPVRSTPSKSMTSSSPSSTSGFLASPLVDSSYDDDNNAPPYMPIQGQRRTASLEKKHKKKSRDGCKQQ